MPVAYFSHRLTVSQDLIGWTEFLHGKVSVEFKTIQRIHLSLYPCRIIAADCMKGLFLTWYNSLIHGGSFVILLSMTNSRVISTYSGAKRSCVRLIDYWTPLQTKSLKIVNIFWSLTTPLCTRRRLNASHIGCSQWKQPATQGNDWLRWRQDRCWWVCTVAVLLCANLLSFGWCYSWRGRAATRTWHRYCHTTPSTSQLQWCWLPFE